MPGPKLVERSRAVMVKLESPLIVRFGGAPDAAVVTVLRYSTVTSLPVKELGSTGRSNWTTKPVNCRVPSLVNVLL